MQATFMNRRVRDMASLRCRLGGLLVTVLGLPYVARP